ncbi:hypothetical protein PF002_g9357 [Phytophthora fragariae]|uniref:Amine oxidase n=1 Tax=Phytophthora fragariae TaxID=53985 RepID=A0A6A4E3U2_9STRA|nr:hypothetical protein PF009_g9097 [Phytophthora fragariae]KAE9016708.1 hypothetical protein PF011_g7034 [Phytophthora fragariae]KAE9147985.1 hypothetical protein PF006_g7393 [Phytophthora fragariae]KAE9241258.1 hypothetical protein PF002_g9357 [Phytophthora fragariae]KAE9316591.1 hypothetical protein PF001_g7257 [Phytophthora fragariae]
MTSPLPLLLLLLVLLVKVVYSARSPPQLPRQFQAEVQVLSHLTDPRQDYPPSVGRMKVQYDFDQQLALAEMLEGYNAGKTFVRRYDLKQEFMVKSGEFRKCERAYLGDAMPTPGIPFTQEFVAMESVRGKVCEHWVHAHEDAHVHVYSDVASNVPIRLTEESVIDGQPMMLLTFDLLNVHVGPQNVSSFTIPDGYERSGCVRNVGGFPYIHAFHYYLRF